MDLWNAHNNLKTVCNKLCCEAYVRQREKEIEEAKKRMQEELFTQLYAFPSNPDPVFLGNTISAMRSERTSFDSLMADMQKRHAEVLKKKIEKDDPLKESLALKFPAFVAEVKLDGERMIVHVNRGNVTMHTRQGRWYR
jgi:ATP-dependent DNA ligase